MNGTIVIVINSPFLFFLLTDKLCTTSKLLATYLNNIPLNESFWQHHQVPGTRWVLLGTPPFPS